MTESNESMNEWVELKADKEYEYKLSDFLQFASDIAYEVENES